MGVSAAYELGFAAALGKPTFAIEKPTDAMLETRVQVVDSVFEILDLLGLAPFG